MRLLPSSLVALLSLALTASAQFQFFEQMFGGHQQQAQQPQNVGSDSSWWRKNYEQGTFVRSKL
jgi:hypothetical protein